MAIIDYTYFQRGIAAIPDIDTVEVKAEVIHLINEHEPQLLQGIMGYPLWKVFDNDISSTTPTSRFADILNGTEYVGADGQTYYWNGLKGRNNISLIADYVYFMYRRLKTTVYTSTGEVLLSSDVGKRTPSSQKMNEAWNRMADAVPLLWALLNERKGSGGNFVYPEFLWQNVDIRYYEPINILGL